MWDFHGAKQGAFVFFDLDSQQREEMRLLITQHGREHIEQSGSRTSLGFTSHGDRHLGKLIGDLRVPVN